MTINKNQVQLLMNKLHISYDEAVDVIQYDELVNKGKSTPYDLNKKQLDNMHKILRKVDHNNAKGLKHNMKPNFEKEETINNLVEFLSTNVGNYQYDNIKITNKTREITFSIGDKDFALTLIEKRRPKK